MCSQLWIHDTRHIDHSNPPSRVDPSLHILHSSSVNISQVALFFEREKDLLQIDNMDSSLVICTTLVSSSLQIKLCLFNKGGIAFCYKLPKPLLIAWARG